MVAFPETWLSGYPTFVWRLPLGASMGKTDALYVLSQANSVDLSRDGLRPLQNAVKEWGMVCSSLAASCWCCAEIHLFQLSQFAEPPLPDKDECVNLGEAVVYQSFGGIIAGPMHPEKDLLIAEIDVAAARAPAGSTMPVGTMRGVIYSPLR